MPAPNSWKKDTGKERQTERQTDREGERDWLYNCLAKNSLVDICISFSTDIKCEINYLRAMYENGDTD